MTVIRLCNIRGLKIAIIHAIQNLGFHILHYPYHSFTQGPQSGHYSKHQIIGGFGLGPNVLWAQWAMSRSELCFSTGSANASVLPRSGICSIKEHTKDSFWSMHSWDLIQSFSAAIQKRATLYFIWYQLTGDQEMCCQQIYPWERLQILTTFSTFSWGLGVF